MVAGSLFVKKMLILTGKGRGDGEARSLEGMSSFFSFLPFFHRNWCRKWPWLEVFLGCGLLYHTCVRPSEGSARHGMGKLIFAWLRAVSLNRDQV